MSDLEFMLALSVVRSEMEKLAVASTDADTSRVLAYPAHALARSAETRRSETLIVFWEDSLVGARPSSLEHRSERYGAHCSHSHPLRRAHWPNSATTRTTNAASQSFVMKQRWHFSLLSRSPARDATSPLAERVR
jgi:hypothetical protein